MTRHLSVPQLVLLMGAAVVVVALLILGAYALHKSFRKQHKSDGLTLKSPRPENEANFIAAALQGVIANLKQQQKELAELHLRTQQHAGESARLSEIIAREMPTGLMVFDRRGFLTQANPAVRALLGIDSWSRRRYPEVLGPESALTALIRDGLEGGRSASWQGMEVRTARGELRALRVFLTPLLDPYGEMSGVVCLLAEGPEAP